MHTGTPRCVSLELPSHRRASAAVRRAARPGPASAIGLGHGVRGNLQGERTRGSHASKRSFAFDSIRAPCRRALQATMYPRATGHGNHRSYSTDLLRPGMAVRSDASVEPLVDRSPCSNTTIATFVGPVRSRKFRNSRTRTGHASRSPHSRAAHHWRSRTAGCRPTTRMHTCFRATPLATGLDSDRIAAHDTCPSQTVYK